MKRMLLTIAIVLALLGSKPAAALGQDSWVAQTILVKKHLIKIGHTDNQGRQVHVGELDGIDYKVLGDQGGWLLVKDRHGAQGWFEKVDAVLLEDAVGYFTELIRHDPANSAAYNYRAWSWTLKGELDIAISDFGEAIRLNPNGAAAYNNRGIAWLRKKEYDRAITDYNEAIRLEPQEMRYRNRGLAWAGKKDYDKAIADHSEAIRLDPRYLFAYVDRGNAWLNKKENGKAIADYSEAIRLDSGYVAAYVNRGNARLNKKEYGKAIADYSEAIRLDPGYAIAFNNRGLAWNKQREYEKAIRDYRQAIKFDTGYVNAYNGLAWLLATCRDEKFRDGNLAIEVAQQACELTNWKDANIVDTLAAAYAEAGQFDKAIHYQETALADASFVRLHETGARQRLQLYQQRKTFREE